MIVFDRELLDNTFLVDDAIALKDGGFITLEELRKIKISYPQLKTQRSLLIRSGFFLLGMLLLSSISGIVALMMLSVSNQIEATLFLYAVIAFVVAELLTRTHFYGFGLDDAFILGAQGMLLAGIGFTTECTLAVLAVMAVIGAVCCARYLSTASALISLIGMTGFVFMAIIDHSIIDKMFLPFAGILMAGLLYWMTYVLRKNTFICYYRNSYRLSVVFSLVLGYASINYLVVRELSESLMGIVIGKGQDIPLAGAFYVLTFLVPLFYIVISIRTKSREMLIVGLLSMAFSFFTIRYYYSLMPLEAALIIGGILLFGLALIGIRKLKRRETGVTFLPDRNSSDALLLAQAAIINSQTHSGHHHVASKMPFGGGGFSGGGAGESF